MLPEELSVLADRGLRPRERAGHRTKKSMASRRQRAAQMVHRAGMKRTTSNSVKKFVRAASGQDAADVPLAERSREDGVDAINYGDTIRLHSLADSGFMIAEGYELNDVLWRPTQNPDRLRGSSDLSPTAAAQFTVVCKHTYDKAKELKETLTQQASKMQATMKVVKQELGPGGGKMNAKAAVAVAGAGASGETHMKERNRTGRHAPY